MNTDNWKMKKSKQKIIYLYKKIKSYISCFYCQLIIYIIIYKIIEIFNLLQFLYKIDIILFYIDKCISYTSLLYDIFIIHTYNYNYFINTYYNFIYSARKYSLEILCTAFLKLNL